MWYLSGNDALTCDTYSVELFVATPIGVIASLCHAVRMWVLTLVMHAIGLVGVRYRAWANTIGSLLGNRKPVPHARWIDKWIRQQPVVVHIVDGLQGNQGASATQPLTRGTGRGVGKRFERHWRGMCQLCMFDCHVRICEHRRSIQISHQFHANAWHSPAGRLL